MARLLRAATIVALAWLALGFALVAALPSAANRLHPGYTYMQYLNEMGKPVPQDAAERRTRERLFQRELKAALRHNADPSSTYVRGLNRFSDWLPEEKAKILLAPGRTAFLNAYEKDGQSVHKGEHPHRPRSFKQRSLLQTTWPPTTPPPASPTAVPEPTATPNATATIPPMPTTVAPTATVAPAPTHLPPRPSLDYRKAEPKVLTDVKDQGQCGSCWAHGTVETVESHIALRTGTLFTLSTQQLVSCVPHLTVWMPEYNATDVMHGCEGYLPPAALDYLVKSQNGTFSQEWEIPYQSYWSGYPNGSAQYKPTPACMNENQRTLISTSTAKVTGSEIVAHNNATAMEWTLFERGPVAVVMFVPNSFFSYTGGVFSDPMCEGYSQMSASHVVQLVGWGHDSDVDLDYWIIRNSWSPTWGEQGYVRMLRQEPEVCGGMLLPTLSNYSLWEPQAACGPCGILSYGIIPTF